MAVGVGVPLAFLVVLMCGLIHRAPVVSGNEHADNDARVLILGAGAAGLQAAQSLVDSGLDNFLVVEAADRIGGRVRSRPFAGMTVETGPTWVLDETPTQRVLDLVSELGLSSRVSDYESLVVRSGSSGEDLTEAAGELYDDALAPALERLAALTGKLAADDHIPDMSQRAALRSGGWLPETALEKVTEWFDFDVSYGDLPETTSVRHTYPVGEEHWMTDPAGLEQIFQRVAPFTRDPKYANHTRLGKKVASVDYTNDISVVVTCEDGTRFVGEYVLITFSLGVLQGGGVEFVPPLPEWKEVAIQKFQMVDYAKVFVSFPSKFWDDAEWILHASERRGYYPAFFNYQAEGFSPGGTPTLVAIITGEEARRVEAQPSDATKAEVMGVLRIMYGDAIPEPTDILVTQWHEDPLTRGAFSNYPVEVDQACYPKLASRVGRVFFGGEATSLAEFGTVDGALSSGEREAAKILACLGDFGQCPANEEDSLACKKRGGGRGHASIARGSVASVLVGLAVALSLKCQVV